MVSLPQVEWSPDGRNARVVFVDPSGKRWYVPLVSEDAWRTDHKLMLIDGTVPKLHCSTCFGTWDPGFEPAVGEVCPRLRGGI